MPSYTFNNAVIDALTLNYYWNLDEQSGNRAGLLGLDLTDVNTVGYATGINGNGADYEVTGNPNERLVAGAGNGITRNNSIIVMSLWIKPESLTNNAYFIYESIDTGGTTRLALILNASGTISIVARFDDATGKTYTSSNTMTAGSWYHVLARWDSVNDVMMIEVNGSNWVNATSIGVNAFEDTASQTGLFLGSAGSTSDCYDGVMDEVGVWLNQLPSSWTDFRDALYNSGTGRFPVVPSTGIQLGPFASAAWGKPYSQGAWR